MARLAVLALVLVACNEDLIDPSDSVVIEIRSDTSSEVVEGEGCPARIVYYGSAQASTVAAAGEWNGFSSAGTALTRDGDGWAVDLKLPPGEYGYKLVINGAYEGDIPADEPTHWVDGVENRNLIVADCTRPRFALTPVGVDGGRLRGSVCVDTAEDAAAITSLTVTLDGVAVGEPRADGQCVLLDEPVGPGKHRLDGTATDAADRTTAEPYWYPFWVEDAPFDWRDATLYMAMPDRFRDSDGVASPVSGPEPIANWEGGDFNGLAQAVDEGWFEQLGVNALWLTPVVQQPEGAFVGSDNVHQYAGYHGYWPVSPDAIDARLGGAEAFKALVAKAHSKGIRVVMDIVLNHVHEQHPYCDEGLCHTTCVCGTAGCDFDGRARDCQFASYLPDLDYRDHATVVRVVADVMKFIRDNDIDGLRLDAVKHVDRSILQAVRQHLPKVEAAPFWLVGETFTGGDGHGLIMQYVGPGRLDGQFDFPLYWSIRDTFVNGGSYRNLENALKASEGAYGAALAYMSPFLGNHDVARIATAIANNDQGAFGNTPDLMAAGGAEPSEWNIINKQSMAFAFLLTLRGVPLIYMGDELGLAGSGDPDNRRLLPTTFNGNQSELLKRVRELGKARRANAVLRRGERRELWIDDTYYVQARWLSEAPVGEPRVMLVAMNKGDTQRTETVTIPAELGIDGKTLKSLFSDRTVTVSGGTVSLQLNPSEYVLLALQ